MSATIVFVHGSFMTSDCWTPVIGRLVDFGITCRTIELPFTSLNDDVDALREAIQESKLFGPVIVVCHSYSGITTSLAAHGADYLVYVAARVPQPGESQLGVSKQWGTEEFRACISSLENGASVLSPDAASLLFNQSPRDLVDAAVRRFRPMMSEIPVVPINNPAWMSVPSAYVVCTDDLVVNVDEQRRRAELLHDSIEIDCDHSPFYSAPDELSRAIISLSGVQVLQ